MNWHAFKERFRYNYKKYLAIIFASLATALMAATGAIALINMVATESAPSITTPISAYNIAFFLVAYLVILIGNVNSSNSAYQGVLIYIFASAFSTAISLLTSGIFNFASFFSGDALTIALTLVQLAFNVFGLIAGVFAYVRLRQYLHSSYVQYEKVRNWTLAFVIFQIISCGFTSALLLIYGYSGISVIMAFLSPISEIFICLAIYFTVLRLRSY